MHAEQERTMRADAAVFAAPLLAELDFGRDVITVMTACAHPGRHAAWLSALARESDFVIVDAPVTDAACLTTSLDRHRPTVLLLDAAVLDRLDPMSLRRIHQRCPEVRVLLVAEQASHRAAVDVLRNHFQGLLPATSAADLCLKAIRAVSRGELWLSRQLLAQVVTDPGWPFVPVDAVVPAEPERLQAMGSLTRRELQVVARLHRGSSNKEIARELGIMEDTVKKHLKSVFAKLGVRRRALVMLQASTAS
ncbi:response regulator transcription factor [Lysobacter solisilvae (ex Woo and Kim 2020)]|uniref:Response regulator transcription factor n=1 Tax=Agrilutibacter terrestris TaxID=2865112 RepID=A0A7H0G0Y4_9GAMM|nr:response regulator transcription factor [Lysobacter terrestris]QNP41950.1 response regulator transcription factor [Lysobacter terrestris]